MRRIDLVFLVVFVVFVCAFVCNVGLAHHAMEYIEIESYSTSKKGESVFHLHYDYMVESKDNPEFDHWEFTPGLSYGVLDELMFDIHAHFAKFSNGLITDDEQANYSPFGPSPFMEAIALTLQMRLPKLLPVDFAIAGTYESPFKRSRELLDGEEVYEGNLIVGRDFAEHSNITFNLKFGKDGDESIKDWALGIKTPISVDPHGIAAGIEFLGTFGPGAEDGWSLLPGIYMPLGGNNTIFKTGLEFGKDSEYMRANATLMHTF